jgi:hypothetical protein
VLRREHAAALARLEPPVQVRLALEGALDLAQHASARRRPSLTRVKATAGRSGLRPGAALGYTCGDDTCPHRTGGTAAAGRAV